MWNRQRTDKDLADPGDVSLGHKSVQRWNLPDGWVISRRPAHEALVSEADFIAAQDVNAARGPSPRADPDCAGEAPVPAVRAAGLRRRAGGGWNRRGRTANPPTGAATATPPPARPSLERPKNAYVREDRILPHLPALHLLLDRPGRTDAAGGAPGAEPTSGTRPAEDVIAYLREQQITLTYDPAAGTLRADTGDAAQTITLKAS